MDMKRLMLNCQKKLKIQFPIGSAQFIKWEITSMALATNNKNDDNAWDLMR